MSDGLVFCPRCDTRWRHRESIGHCAACHHTFIGVGAFDRHQHLNDNGRSRCLDPGMEQRLDGNPAFELVQHTKSLPSGTFWRAWSSDEQKAKGREHFARLSGQRYDETARVGAHDDRDHHHRATRSLRRVQGRPGDP